MLISESRKLVLKCLPLLIGLLLSLYLPAQTYNPSVCCTVSNKSYGAAQAVSTDGRSWFYDATNFVMRDYNGTPEVFSYLNLAKYRSGHFPIYVHSGGVLQGNGVWLGGATLVYWFKDSTGNANLVRWYTDSTGLPGAPFYSVANDLSEGNAGLIKGNLALDLVNNTSDAQKNAAAVALTNHTIDGNSNTLVNIANSSLAHSTIGLTLNSTGATPQVTTTPAALGNSIVLTVPWTNGSDSGFLRGTDWSAFHEKNDSTTVSNDTLYNWVNGVATVQSVVGGTGGVRSTWPIVQISDTLNFDKYDYNQKLTHSGINARGDSIYWYGDSWTNGQNCTGGGSPVRYSTVVTQAMAGLEVNFGVNGGTLEKRIPIDRFTGVNMIDRLSEVPPKTFNRKMLVYSFGLNDWGVGGGNYDSANFETDYDSVIHYTLLQGWDTSQILILTPPWVGVAAATYYSTINGGTTPTAANLVSFVNAAINVATKWRIKYVDLYHDMLKNDTTLFAGSGQGADHPCDSGYAYLGADIIQFISPGVNGNIGYIPRFINNSALGPSGIFDNLSKVSFTEPIQTTGQVNIGGPFGRITYTDQANSLVEFATFAGGDTYFIYDAPDNDPIMTLTLQGTMALVQPTATMSIAEGPQTSFPLEVNGKTSVIGQIEVSGPTAAMYWHRQDNNAKTWAWYTPDGSFRANNGADELQIQSTGQLQFNAYGTGAFTGTAAFLPAFTSTGQIIEVNTSGVSRYVHSIFTPLTGGTVNLVNNRYNIVNPAGALLALTVNLPSTPANNDVVFIKFTQTITAVTYANGTVVDGIAGPAAGGLVVLTYDSGTTSWY